MIVEFAGGIVFLYAYIILGGYVQCVAHDRYLERGDA